jgi:dienelactone hydrolase
MYSAGHAFANAHRPAAFVPAANVLAHRRVAEFLAKHLG